MILLSCLLALLFSSSLTHAVKYAIDLKRCAKETACYVAASCLKEPEGETGLVKYTYAQLKEPHYCHIVLQMKPMNVDKTKTHVMMQAKAVPGAELNPEKGIRIVQETVVFACAPNKFEGNAKFKLSEHCACWY